MSKDPASKPASQKPRGFTTRLVAFEAAPGDPYQPSVTPVYQTATFEQDGPGDYAGGELGSFDYSRSGNPTRAVLEKQLAKLEGGARGLAFASGMAAIACVTRLLRPGDEIVTGDDVYGGTHRLFSRLVEPLGITVRNVDMTDAAKVLEALTPRTKLVHVETPSNPRLKVTDLAAVAEVAQQLGALVSVDSTAMTPYVQRPIEHGADVVIHSATKALNGHSDVSAGVLVTATKDLGDRLAFIQNAEGSALGPWDSFLVLRGLKTLSLRVDRQQHNAAKVAHWLANRSDIASVRSLALETHPGKAVHDRQAKGPGCLVSFELGSQQSARRFVTGLELFAVQVSFGGVSSSVCVPSLMSHASVPAETRRRHGLSDGLVRLSVGIEDVEDLLADLSAGLARVNESEVKRAVIV